MHYMYDLQLPVQSVPITTKVVSSNTVHGEVHSIQHYVIKFVSNLRQVGEFLQVLRFPPPIKLTAETFLRGHSSASNMWSFKSGVW
jgi:hypothetical protein